MIHSDSHICNERLEKTGKRLSDSVHYLDLHSPLQQAVFCRIYGNTMLFTRELFNRATPFLEIIPHDWWLSYNATLCGGVKYLGEPLVYYRQHSSNIYGAIGTRDKKKEKNSSRIEEKNTHFSRMQKFYEICPETMNREKRVLSKLTRSYRNLSFANNCLRMVTFFGNYKLLLVVKKRSQLRNYLFCLKTFFKTI